MGKGLKCPDCGQREFYSDKTSLWGKMADVKKCAACDALVAYKGTDGQYHYAGDLV